MNSLSRRSFLQSSLAVAAVTPAWRARGEGTVASSLDLRICGLLYGTAFGDALGGPIEFQTPASVHALPNPPKLWRDDEVMDGSARAASAARIQLRPYHDLRPQPESYGQWNVNSAPGTITDDTRHKLILLHTLRIAEQSGRWPIGVRDLAQSFLDWPRTAAITAHPEYLPLAADWLEEWQFSARWVLGERDLKAARPPGRMWQGLPTCCGQMTSLPLAAVFAGDPGGAYLAAWQLGFFDNGFGKDLNAALVAGLSVALVTPVDSRTPKPAWERVFQSMRATDPYGYANIRWSERAVDRWLNFALRTAREADGHPSRMFAVWEREFASNSKWEAQIPFVVAFGCIAMANFDPLAALQLTQEWGWDTDSYAQVLGAFIGALYGPGILRPEWRVAVAARLKADHQVDLDDECRLVSRLHLLGGNRTLVREE